jgi:HAD superfamily hydrolase (TIGR01549 family)
MSRPNLILFDLDGTLIDSYEAIYHSAISVLNKYSEKTPSRQEVFKSVGLPIAHLFDSYLIEPILGEAVIEFREHLMVHGHEKTMLIPGAKFALEDLKSKNFQLSLVTNKQTALAKSVLAQQGLSKYFDLVVGSDLGRPKPSPDLIKLALSKFPRAFKPAMVGDRAEDMQAARDAGIEGIFLINPHHGLECLPSLFPYKPRVITTLRELPEIVNELKVD